MVFDGGSLQFGNFPEFVPDQAGGAVFAWYGVSPLQCYTQHLLSDGSEVFPHNGVVASTLGSQLRVSPSISYLVSTQEIFMFWTELNSMQSEFGIYGQSFASDGARQWGDSGVVLVALDSTERTQVRSVQVSDGAVAFWVESLGAGNDLLLAARLNGAGHPVWSPAQIDVSAVASDKSRLAVARTSVGAALLCWKDDRTAGGDIYAQRLNADGTLGAPACPPDFNSDNMVNAADLALLLGAWGPNPGHPADINTDGTVNAADLALLLGAWGPCQ